MGGFCFYNFVNLLKGIEIPSFRSRGSKELSQKVDVRQDEPDVEKLIEEEEEPQQTADHLGNFDKSL